MLQVGKSKLLVVLKVTGDGGYVGGNFQEVHPDGAGGNSPVQFVGSWFVELIQV
jgi:hypothetical protein